MESLTQIAAFAKKNWPALFTLVIAIFIFSSRSAKHSYRSFWPHGTETSRMQADNINLESESAGLNDSAQSFGKGLGSKLKAEAMPMMAASPPVSSGPASWIPTAHAEDSSMLIKNGNISAYVDSLQSTKQTIAEKIKKHGARVDSESQRSEYSGLILDMTIKIPAGKFQALYDELLTLSDKVHSNSINVTDVTKEYVDVKARLENKKILQERFRDLAKRSGKVGDILQVEQELARVSEDIDSTTRIMKQYENDVAFSTIYLNITEPKANGGPDPAPIGFIKKVGLAFKAGFDWILDSILEFISWWPMILVLSGGYLAYRQRKKKK